MKDLLKRAVLGTGILRLAAAASEPGAAILMYHSVMDDPAQQESLLGGIVHSRRAFRQQMQLLARRYHPVSLDDVHRLAKEGGSIPPRAVAVTFDDGYADNYEIAAPILREFGIPAAFYVTVDCVEKRQIPWPARLRFAFRASKKESWSDSSGNIWSLRNSADRENAYLYTCDVCCTLTGAGQERYVAEIERELGAQVESGAGQLMMTYAQIKKLGQEGHIVGSHTVTHPNLAHVSPPELRIELGESKRRLEHELQCKIRHFSYPCPALPPNWTDLTEEESRKAGYQTAVTTDYGLARKSDNPLRWKRITPTKTALGLHWNLERAFTGAKAKS